MTDINRVDQLVLQLRAQLQRLAKQRRRAASRAEDRIGGPLERIREQGPGRDHRDDGEFRRTFVRALLTEELGEQMGNLPEFQQVSAEVWRMIEEDHVLRQQLMAAIDQFDRSGG